jgi:hypothetical protein
MANDLFRQMQAQQRPQGGDMMYAFTQMMEQGRGKDPRAIINQMVQSGKLSQQQLNMVHQRAQQMSGMFDQLKNRFGF